MWVNDVFICIIGFSVIEVKGCSVVGLLVGEFDGLVVVEVIEGSGLLLMVVCV